MNLIPYALTVLTFCFSLSAFASASLSPQERFEGRLAADVARLVPGETDCERTARAALDALRQDTPPFQVLEQKQNIIDFIAATKGNLSIQSVTFFLPPPTGGKASSNLRGRSLAHSFLLLRSDGGWRICDSFQRIRPFACRPISPEALSTLNASVKRYVSRQTGDNARSILMHFLSSQQIDKIRPSVDYGVDISTFYALPRVTPVENLRESTTEQINELFKSPSAKHCHSEQSGLLRLAQRAKVPLISKLTFDVPLDGES